MAYVTARRRGRFEIRESVHTERGPRARSLAGFEVLSDEVLAKAAQRAQRPFDAGAVLASGRRAGAKITAAGAASTTAHDARATIAAQAMPGSPRSTPGNHRLTPGSHGSTPGNHRSTPGSHGSNTAHPPPGRFLAASNRMVHSLRREPQSESMSPGAALIDLLGFADAVTASQPPRPAKPLAFPALARLVADRHAAAGLAAG